MMKVESTMRARFSALAMVVCLLACAETVSGGSVFSGYEKLGWDADIAQVVKMYPRGQMAKLGEEVIYKQIRPSKAIARRSFGFRNGKLHAVAVTLEKRHVEKMGIEQILGEQIKFFGEGNMDRSKAPHMINYIWDGADTRIIFGYAPKRPDMSVIMYEQK